MKSINLTLLQHISQEASLWRRDLHRHPQTMFEETYASDFVAAKLSEWGISHERHWVGTGIVATIYGQHQSSGKAIALRADLDALNITEADNKPWVSLNKGKMHGCGHDGHTAMLLGAAKYLQSDNDFDGTVHFVFQPAEEGGNGGRKMIEAGLFKKHPVSGVYGLHNWPWMPRGTIGLCKGPIMAGDDNFKITFIGKGGHAAMPHKTKDPVPAIAQAIFGIQNLIAREIDPLSTAVISITNVHAGTGALNVIPDHSELSGSIRTLTTEMRDFVRVRLHDIVKCIALTHGLTSEFEFIEGVCPTINDPVHVDICLQAAIHTVGQNNVNGQITPAMTAEDFGEMLQAQPGCYIWLGQMDQENPDAPSNCSLHTSHYDFNDAVIPTGISYWANLTKLCLAVK